jgi:hypothetical protein
MQVAIFNSKIYFLGGAMDENLNYIVDDVL